jgi:ATP-dependent Clp protease ATP-binding subunit ClpA
MLRVEVNLVLKYCEALDEFVKIRSCAEEDAKRVLEGASTTNKSAYQREVVRACVYDFNQGLESRVERGRASGQDLVEIIYLLVVEVNPALEIHQVAVPLTTETTKTATVAAKKKDEERLERLLSIDRDLKRRVIGQDHAVDVVARAVKKAGVGLRDPRRPVGAFLFVGHVGVGKTELAKAVSESLYGSQARLLRVDCSEYALPHEYAKLIGAPPGYIGHNEGGYLTEAAKELDEFVVLFDEIEKAHSKMHNILLQLLDEGTVTDSKGFKVSFKNALVLMTSNLGVREADQRRRAIGFDADERASTPFEQMRAEIDEALRKCFRPEFLNRIDDVIVFNTLTKNESTRIADLMLQDLAQIAQRAGVVLKFSPEVKRYVVDIGWSRECGARELKRTIKKHLETPLTDLILQRTIREGATVKVRVSKRELVFDAEAKGANDSAANDVEEGVAPSAVEADVAPASP